METPSADHLPESGRAMIEIILFSVFFAGIVIGGLIADATGRLPSAEGLQAEDLARYTRIARERGTN